MIKEKMNNMDNMMAAQEQEAQEALEELRAENLVANHVLRGGCVEPGAPCVYSNGPCCCEGYNCPFGQWNSLDEGFVHMQLSKLHSKDDIARAEEEIRRARILAQQAD